MRRSGQIPAHHQGRLDSFLGGEAGGVWKDKQEFALHRGAEK